jgi:hypothetical protein
MARTDAKNGAGRGGARKYEDVMLNDDPAALWSSQWLKIQLKTRYKHIPSSKQGAFMFLVI